MARLHKIPVKDISNDNILKVLRSACSGCKRATFSFVMNISKRGKLRGPINIEQPARKVTNYSMYPKGKSEGGQFLFSDVAHCGSNRCPVWKKM